MTAPQQPIKLYWHPLSAHAHRAALFCSLAGIPFERIETDLAARAHKRPEFLAKNMFGLIPVMEDGETVLADSNAIMVFLAKTYAPTWAPKDLREEAEIQRWFSIAAGPLRYSAGAARIARVFGGDLDFAAAEKSAAALFEIVDAHLGATAFLIGAKPSLADLAFYTYAAHAPEGGIPLEPYPALTAWIARIEALPGFLPMARSETGLWAKEATA